MSNSRIIIALAAVAVPALTAATLPGSREPERLRIAGVFSMKVDRQYTSPVADQAGPVLLLTESSGTNHSTGPSKYMEGARVLNREIADLTQGNGPHQGYITEILGADTSVTSWQGRVTTTLGPDQQPRTSFEGTWTKVSGTGRYAGVTGKGTYKGRMTSQTEYTVEYAGEIVTQRTASR